MAANPSFIGVVEISKPANTDLSTKYLYAADLNSSGNVVVAGAGSTFIGIITGKPAAAGRACTVAISGQVPMYAGGTIAIGAPVKIDSSGLGVSASSGDKAIGRAMSAGASGSQFELLIQSHTVA